MVASVTRTTLTLPVDLLARVDEAVRHGRARSRNAFVMAALERDLAAQEQPDLDAEFAAMAQDDEYLAESAQLDAEFAGASVEALRLAEGPAGDVMMSTMRAWIQLKAPNARLAAISIVSRTSDPR